MHHLSRTLTLLLILVTPSLYGQIFIDGQFDDWEEIDLFDDTDDQLEPGQLDIESVSITNNANDLFITVAVDRELDLLDSENLTVFIDADNNPETGYEVNGIGAEISYYFGERRGFINFPDESINVNHSVLGIIAAPTVTSNTFEFSVNRGFANNIGPMSLGAQLKIVIRNSVEGGDILPNDEGGIPYQWDFQNEEQIPYTLDKQNNSFRLLSYNVEFNSFFNSMNGPLQQKLIQLAQPDIIAFQEMTGSDTEAATVLNGLWEDDEDWACYSFGSDTKLCLQGIEFEAGTFVDGNTANLIIFDDGSELIVINAHFPCCANDEQRQAEIDHIMARIRDEEFGFLASENTPVIITGDLNLVGLAQNITSLTTGDIIDEATYGADFTPDHNGSDYIDAAPYCTGIPYNYTWNNPFGSYAAGRLDFIIYGGDYMKLTNSFVMATEGFTASDRFNNDIDREDSVNASDHYPLVSDFTFILDEDGDGSPYQEDCDDSNPEIHPGAPEIPNNDIDEDCDGVANQIDEDGDGFNSDNDCDDTVAAINPDAVEVPNDGIDNNCDGFVDETYLDWPFMGWKQTYQCNDLYSPHFGISQTVLDTLITRDDGLEYYNGAYRSENGVFYVQDKVLFDFTLAVGDTFTPEVQSFEYQNGDYDVISKEKILSLSGLDSLFRMELVNGNHSLVWIEGFGSLSSGLFIDTWIEGGCGALCAVDSLNLKIYEPESQYSCNCDCYYGIDNDQDTYFNKVSGVSNFFPQTFSLTGEIPYSNYERRLCDTLFISQFGSEQGQSPNAGFLSWSEDCTDIISPDNFITYQANGFENGAYVYESVIDIPQDIFIINDQCQAISKISFSICTVEDCDDNNPDINPGAIEIPNNDIDEDCDGNALIIDEDQDGFNSDEDCDDTNADINPDATEVINNNIDEDCDGEALIIDEDNDGFNSDEDCDDDNPNINPDADEIPNNEIDEDCDGNLSIIDADEDGFNSNEDCDDTNPDINPDAAEIPNNDIDEDCDGNALIIDEDNDGFNSDEDCDDSNADINPDATEIANNDIDEDCNGNALIIDEDNDGFNSDEDCDDNNADINPDATEIANNDIDEDCDGDVLIIDEDNDGFNSDEDCDDNNADINPDATEIANNDIDEDCDGQDLTTYYNFLQTNWRQGYEQRVGTGGPIVNSEIYNSYIFRDSIISDTIYKVISYERAPNLSSYLARFEEGKIFIRSLNQELLLLDFTANVGDTILVTAQIINPMFIVESKEFTHLLNGQQVRRIGLRGPNDPIGSATSFWLEGVGFENSGLSYSFEFEDGGIFHICTSQNDTILYDETIVENVDCRFIIDSYTLDEDGDGFFLAEDCDDTDSSINPDAIELCDGLDNNCDGNIDEDLELIVYYSDNDMDGYGVEGEGTESCLQPPDTTTEFGDCNDEDPLINPDAIDIPNNGIDENCDGEDTVSSVNEINKNIDINVYPNPFSDNLIIENRKSEFIKLSIYTSDGKRVYQKDIMFDSESIDVNQLVGGVYIIKVESDSGVKVSTFVKI